MKKFNIDQFYPCNEGAEYYATQVDFETAWNNCERGDWMLWIAKKMQVDDRKLTLAKAYCANTVRHLMKDQRSLDAVDAAIKYGNGQISREELDKFASDAKDASAAAYSAAASNAAYAASFADSYSAAAAAYAASFADSYAAFYASFAASYAASAAAYSASTAASSAASAADYSAAAAAYSAASAADYAAAAAAKEENQKQTADICRECLTEEVFNKINNN